jgi:hypothetical protein
MQISPEAIRNAVMELRPILERAKANTGVVGDILASREKVLSRFQPIFSIEHIPQLTAEEFQSFLSSKNNRHWGGLQRLGSQITSDMELLRKALLILLDENRSLESRLDILRPYKKPAMVKNLGRAFITPILMVSHPEKYGVMNNPSIEGARLLNVLPEFKENAPFSKKYIAFNDVLVRLATSLDTDLWTLNALWWGIIKERSEQSTEREVVRIDKGMLDTEQAATDELGRFGLERYLQEFMRDNWDKIPELMDWTLFEEDGEIVGFEYNTNSIGRIDLLAHHKREGEWLVIELKKIKAAMTRLGRSKDTWDGLQRISRKREKL